MIGGGVGGVAPACLAGIGVAAGWLTAGNTVAGLVCVSVVMATIGSAAGSLAMPAVDRLPFVPKRRIELAFADFIVACIAASLVQILLTSGVFLLPNNVRE